MQGHSKGAMEAGCDAFVAKPCLPDQLVAEIRKMLSTPRVSAAKAEG
jgi:DNA-binding response OmpR family regulator